MGLDLNRIRLESTESIPFKEVQYGISVASPKITTARQCRSTVHGECVNSISCANCFAGVDGCEATSEGSRGF